MRPDAVRPLQRGLVILLATAGLMLGGACAGGRSSNAGELRPRVMFVVDSEPLGGMVRVNGIRVGTTPTGVAIEVNDDGTAWSDTTISLDQRINPRAPSSEEVRIITFQAGDDLPARLFFQLGEEPRRTGRALLRDR